MKHMLLLCLAAASLSLPRAAVGNDDPLGTFGIVRLIVFDADAGTPVKDVAVRVGAVSMGETNEDGTVNIEILDGLYHFTLDVGDDIEREIALRVVPDAVVEAIAEISAHSDAVALTVESGTPGGEKVAVPQDDRPLSSIKGVVRNEETGGAIADARIFVRGQPVEAKTDADGRFEIQVPVGTHDVVVVHSEFGTVTKSGIAVGPDAPAEVVVETAAVGVELAEFTVTAPKIEGSSVSILEERQETSQVSDIIGAEQMSKSGDSDAAAALRRVTGVTIVGGKYVYVRGMGDRYSSTLLNRLNLPSPDPERRVVPLDMFPAGILDSMVIQKSFSPDMPGEFGGGAVDLRTKGYPDKTLFNLELSGAVTTGSTFANPQFSTDRGPTDFLGIDGGHRALPKVVEDATKDGSLQTGDQFHPGYSREELAAFSRAMPKNWGMGHRRLAPDFKIGITGGKGFRLKKTKLGFLASGLYKNEWDNVDDKIVRDYSIVNGDTGELGVNNRYEFNETTNTITLGGILALGVDLDKGHSIKANTIVNRITDNSFWQYEGFSFDRDRDIKAYQYEWIERMIFSQQVLGEHLLSERLGLKLDWRYAFSNAQRDEPDKRMVAYEYRASDDLWWVSSHPAGNRRDYLYVDDNAHDVGLDLSLPFKQWTKEAGLVKAGGAVLIKDREVDVRRFPFGDIDNLSVDVRSEAPERFFVDENMSADGMVLEERTMPTDNYTGEQEVFAGYVMGELPLGLGFKLVGGVRLEQSKQRVSTFGLFSTDAPVKDKIDEMDVLPSVAAIYAFGPEMLIRLGYGKTVNRPDFSEMTPGCRYGIIGGHAICGAWSSKDFENDLSRAVLHNVDLRWEWYPSQGESISFGGFFKEFIDPLERVVKTASDKVKFITNTEGARNFGLEFDVRKNLEFIHEAVRDVYVAGNATWIRSRIVIPDDSSIDMTNRKRPLQGQSPYVFNFQLGYDNVDIGTSAVVLYNVFGKRISDVGSGGLPDVYEQPFHQLDIVLKQKIKDRFEIGFKAQNLLNWDVAFLQGGEVTERHTKGRKFTLSASFKY